MAPDLASAPAKMGLRSRWLANGGVRLHFLDSGVKSGQAPIVLVPGATENAYDHATFLSRFERRAIAVTLRGRMPSDAPPHGYRLEDHASDIAALIDHLALDRIVLYAFSRGVSYALAFALARASCIGALVLADYPPVHTALPPDWASRAWSDAWRGRPTPERMPRHALDGMQREAAAFDLSNRLDTLACPVLIVAGDRERGSLLDAESEEIYLCRFANVVVHRRPLCGHDVREPDEDGLFERVRLFIERHCP